MTYYYEGGSSKELYAAEEEIASMTLTSYNANSGAFWGGGYSSNVYITNASGDPKATFSDRIYIGKNQYTGYYEIKSILTSGGSKWAEGAEYVISISSSYSDYRTEHAKVQKLNVGDVVIIYADDLTTISKDKTAKVGFYGTELKGSKVVVEKEDISIEFEDGILFVSASVKINNDEKYLLRERRGKNVRRTFSLGDVDEESIKAKLENGLLIVNVSFKEEIKKEKKSIIVE